MTSAPDGQHGIFLGNLDDGKNKKEVATMISRLILEAAGFVVEAPAIKVRTSRNGRCFTAWFNLTNQESQQRAFRALKNYSSVPEGLVKSGRKLRVDIYKPKIIVAQLPTTNSSSNLATHEAFIDDQSNHTASGSSNHGATSALTDRSFRAASVGITSPEVIRSADNSLVTVNTTSSGTSLLNANADVFRPAEAAASPGATSGATSLSFSLEAASLGGTTPGAATPRVTSPIRNGSVKSQRVYTKGEVLEQNETRVLEFKKAGGDLQKCLKKHLARYVCAFLNSEGGTLMLGVEDTGCVCGVQCNRKLEDTTRLSIDNIIQHFEPSVLPQLYQVQFVPVRNDSGIQPNLKVIEVFVEPGREDFLYETPNREVFIKRDGSVRGPLRPKDIQEWCRLKYNNKPVQNSETNLKDQVNNLQERLQKLESDRQEDSTKDHKNIQKSSSEQDNAKNHKGIEKSSSDQDTAKDRKDVKKTSSAVCTIL